MTQNVFFSWQSDLPAKTNHYFIKDCLERAIKKLNNADDFEIDEPIRLDHDTKNVPGQPTIFEVIAEKIEECTVFVADVSLVGTTPTGKKLTNSNVSVEYGMALQKHGDRRLITVMNTAYGSPEDLPFDLRHKRWPSAYCLPENASVDQIQDQRKKLVEGFYIALKTIFEQGESKPAIPMTVETPSTENPALFFNIDEPLLKDRSGNEYRFLKNDAYAYLKLIPIKRHEKLTSKQLNRLNSGEPVLRPFTKSVGCYSFEKNKFGAIYPANDGDDIPCFSQVMKNTREIWGVNAHLLRNEHVEELGDIQYIPSIAIEEAFVRTLANYIDIAVKKMDIEGDVKIVAGFSGVDGYHLTLGQREYSEVIHEEVIEMEFIVDPYDTNPEVLLKPFFEYLWDECGYDRPDNLR